MHLPTGSRLALLLCGAGCVLLAVWLLPRSTPDADPTPPVVDAPVRTQPARPPPPRPIFRDRTPAPPRPVPREAGDDDAPAEPLELEALFPAKSVHRCAASTAIPDGRYTAESDSVMVRDGQTAVVAARPTGHATVRAFGRVLGDVEWADGACRWQPTEEVTLRGYVTGGGSHTIAGCPVGDVVQTDDAGYFEVRVPRDQLCAVRTIDIDDDFMAMSKPVQFDATADAEVVLVPPEPLSEALVTHARELLSTLGDRRIAELQAELDHWTGAQDGSEAAAWMLAVVERDLDFFESERAALDDPEQARQVVVEFLYGTSN